MDTETAYVLLVALTPPGRILLTITDEFLGIWALSLVYAENNINAEKNINQFIGIYTNL